MVFIVCDWCGTEARKKNQSKNTKHSFCTRQCFDKWYSFTHKGTKDSREVKKCHYCNVEFYTYFKDSLFCSNGCYNKSRTKDRVSCICKVCGVEFQITPNQTRKFCSKNCWGNRNPKIEFICSYCKKSFLDYETNRYGSNNYYCSKPCCDLHKREIQKGENGSRWIDGRTPEQRRLRKTAEYRVWRTAVFERDNYICQKCGKQGHYLHAHHIKHFSTFPELRLDIDNGITWCLECHKAKGVH